MTLFDRTETFLTLVSLTAPLIGGFRVSSAVRWLGQRMPVLATLKCLGAPAALIFRIYFSSGVVSGASAQSVGLGLAAMGPPIAEKLLGGVFAGPMAGGLHHETAAGRRWLWDPDSSCLFALAAWQGTGSQTGSTVPDTHHHAGRPPAMALPFRHLGCVSHAHHVDNAMATTSLELAIGFVGGLAASLVILALVSEVVMAGQTLAHAEKYRPAAGHGRSCAPRQ